MIAKVILLKKTSGHKSFMIRLTDTGKKHYRSIETPFTVDEWNYNPKKRKNELKALMPKMDGYDTYKENKQWVAITEKKYQDVIDNLVRLKKPFTAEKVFSLVNKPKTDYPNTVYSLFKYRIAAYKEADKYGTAESYHGTMKKLMAFHKRDMIFIELDDKRLLKFKKWMLDEGLSLTTVSIHLRQTRSMWNYAIREAKVASREDYPFENPKVMAELKTGYKSRAISKVDVEAIRKLKPKKEAYSNLWHACNYFLFGYLGRGINFQDMARLKWSNIEQGRVTYIRRKTRSKIQEETSFTLSPELVVIISEYRELWKTLPNYMNNPYVFPLLNPSYQKEMSIHHRIKKMRKIVNSHLKKVGEAIESEIPITTYTWRHSFAAIAKNDLNVDVAMISELLGHHDLETTKHYLKQFDHDSRDKALIGL